MAVRAVLFDFSGTLFRLEEDDSWLAEITGGDGQPLDVAGKAELLRRLTAPVTQVVEFTPEYQRAWDERDLDPQQHRKIYLEVLRASGVHKPEEAEALYRRLIDPLCWTPYPDTVEVFRRLHDDGIKTAVISNIAFDIRPAFERWGVLHLIDEVLMSYVEGMIKPDARLFQRACDRLGVRPEDALMVGDSEEADGGAAAIGCPVAIVDPLPTRQRPNGLLDAVAAHHGG